MQDDLYDLTPAERALLKKHLAGYEKLVSGEAPANTEARRHFIAVTRGQAKAKTPHEIAFIKYRRWQAAQRTNTETTGTTIDAGQAAYPDHVWNKLKDARWPKGYRNSNDV
jgi:uncharacterized protein YifE (UPF0438 family)